MTIMQVFSMNIPGGDAKRSRAMCNIFGAPPPTLCHVRTLLLGPIGVRS